MHPWPGNYLCPNPSPLHPPTHTHFKRAIVPSKGNTCYSEALKQNFGTGSLLSRCLLIADGNFDTQNYCLWFTTIIHSRNLSLAVILRQLSIFGTNSSLSWWPHPVFRPRDNLLHVFYHNLQITCILLHEQEITTSGSLTFTSGNHFNQTNPFI